MKVYKIIIKRTALGQPITQEILEDFINPLINDVLGFNGLKLNKYRLISWEFFEHNNYVLEFTTKELNETI